MEDKNLRLSKSVRSALRYFVYYYFNGTLGFVTGVSELLNKNYVKKMSKIPSNVEMMFAIFSNNISLDDNGEVQNFDEAIHRAAQFIAVCIAKPDNPYEVNPPFEDWESAVY